MIDIKAQYRTKLAVFLTIVATAWFSAPSLAKTHVRLQSSSDTATFSEGYKLSVEHWSTQTRLSQAHTESQFQHHWQDRPQVWISDIGTLLFDDLDGDGYHSGFSITIDVDSDYGDTEIYAKIYLQSTITPPELLHQTSQFSIYGTTVGDAYRIDTELRNNFAAQKYDVMIDIHDAWSDQLLDTANARGFSNLSALPLESGEHDQLSEDEHADYFNETSSADVVVTEYAGVFHPALLIILIGSWLARRRLIYSRH